MVTKNIKKYIKVYLVLFKYSLIQSTAYRVSFLIELFVELGYQATFLLFFEVIFSNIEEVAGWSYPEMLFLSGLNIFTSELLVGSVFIFGLWRLPENIKNGHVDIALLKPINSLFNLTLSRPYFTSLLSSLTGFYVMYQALVRLDRPVNPINILLGILVFLCGALIAYSVSVIISSLSFKFLNATTLPRIGEKLVLEFKVNPHDAYQGILRLVLFFVLPVVFFSSIPSSTILRGADFSYVVLSVTLAGIFLITAFWVWNRMIGFYSSASS